MIHIRFDFFNFKSCMYLWWLNLRPETLPSRKETFGGGSVGRDTLTCNNSSEEYLSRKIKPPTY